MLKALSIVVLAASVLAQAQSTNGKNSGLTPAQIQKVRATHLKFVLPTEVPKGYKVSTFELQLNQDRRLINLNIIYKKGPAQITLQQCSDGIGDLIMDDGDSVATTGTYTFRNPLFPGKQALDHQLQKGKPFWGVNWITLPGKTYPRFVSAIGENSQGADGVTLMESLRFLK